MEETRPLPAVPTWSPATPGSGRCQKPGESAQKNPSLGAVLVGGVRVTSPTTSAVPKAKTTLGPTGTLSVHGSTPRDRPPVPPELCAVALVLT